MSSESVFPHPDSTAFSRTDTLTLEQAISIALEHNGTITTSELGVRHAESRVREIRGNRLPPLMFHSHYLHAPESGYNEIVTNGGEYGIRAGTSYPLYDGGVRSAQMNQALADQERSTVSLDKTRSDLRFTVRSLYFEGLQDQEEVHIRDEAVGRLQDYVQFLQRQRLGGAATESDLLKAQVDLNNARIAADVARRSLQKTLFDLQNVIGGKIAEQHYLAPLSAESDSTAVPEFSATKNYSIRLLQHELLSTSYEVTIARADRLPSLTIAADAGVLGVTPREFHNDLGYSVLLTLELPIFDWGALNSRIEQKELGYQQAVTQLNLQQRQLETDWRNTLADLQSQRKTLEAYRLNRAQAEQNFLSAKSRFAGGSGSNLEVLDAQRLLNEVALNYNSTLFQLRLDLATALHLAGD